MLSRWKRFNKNLNLLTKVTSGLIVQNVWVVMKNASVANRFKPIELILLAKSEELRRNRIVASY